MGEETSRRVLAYNGHGRRLKLKQGHAQQEGDVRKSARGGCLIPDSVPFPNQLSLTPYLSFTPLGSLVVGHRVLDRTLQGLRPTNPKPRYWVIVVLRSLRQAIHNHNEHSSGGLGCSSCPLHTFSHGLGQGSTSAGIIYLRQALRFHHRVSAPQNPG